MPELYRSEVVVVGLGARTPNGMTALQVAMTSRARKSFPRASHMIDRAGEPMGVCRLAAIGDDVLGLERLVALAAPAAVQATHSWMTYERARTQAPAPLPAVIAVAPETRPGFDRRVLEELIPRLQERSGVPLDVGRSSVVAGCRGGGAGAVLAAVDRIKAGEADAILVGGVDSFFDPDALEHLDAERRLHSLACENGFIPGEAAAFVLLASRRRASSVHRFSQILAAAMELEPRPYGSPEPCLALGMTLALKKAVAPLGEKAGRIRWALTDVVNERHRIDEWSYALRHVHGAFAYELEYERPFVKMGDVGAASTAVMLVLASIGWHTGCALGDCAVVATHSEGNERGAVLVAAEAP